MSLPQLPASSLPSPKPGGSVFFSGWGETPEAREKALRAAELQRQRRAEEAERPKHRPQMERLSDAEARELTREGERQLAENSCASC